MEITKDGWAIFHKMTNEFVGRDGYWSADIAFMCLYDSREEAELSCEGEYEVVKYVSLTADIFEEWP